MATVFTSSLRLALPTSGTEAGTWGDTVNNGITSLTDKAVAGTATIVMTTADYTLTTASGSADEARAMFIKITGTPGAARSVICPAVSKLYFVQNASTGGFAQTFKTPSGSGISIPNGSYAALYCDGTNVVAAFSYATALTLGSALPTASGGTGLSSPGTTGNVLVSNGTIWTSVPASGSFPYPGVGIPYSTGSAWGSSYSLTGSGGVLALATSPVFVTPTLGTIVSGDLAAGTNAVAYGIKSATTTVSVSAATAPAIGQVLTATGSAAATWQTPTAQAYPGAGVPNSTGSAWGTSYSTTGSGTVLALATSPTLVTPALGTIASGDLAAGTNAVAYGIKSATTTVSVSAATAPTVGQVLTAINGTSASWQAAGGGGIIEIQDITSGASNWTKPAGASMVLVMALGGGGSGGSGRVDAVATHRGGGSGGGGGAMVERWFRAADLGGTVAYSVAAAQTTVGASVSSAGIANGNAGTAGNSTTFGTGSLQVLAAGGSGGVGGVTGASGGSMAPGANAAGGTAGISGTNVFVPGGAGGSSGSSTPTAGNAEYGGGSGVGSATNQAGYGGGSSIYGGPGGGSGGGIDNTNASQAGGAGGASNKGTNGGGGAAGGLFTAGTAGAAIAGLLAGTAGGGGGAAQTTNAGGTGGNGGRGAGGGGGGAGIQTSANSGAGGQGGSGRLYIVTFGGVV